jgi:hypothetical protein
MLPGNKFGKTKINHEIYKKDLEQKDLAAKGRIRRKNFTEGNEDNEGTPKDKMRGEDGKWRAEDGEGVFVRWKFSGKLGECNVARKQKMKDGMGQTACYVDEAMTLKIGNTTILGTGRLLCNRV